LRKSDFLLRGAVVARLSGVCRASSGGGFAQEEQSFEVIDQIGHADFHCGARDTDRPHEQSIRSFCVAKICSTRERIFDLAALARRIASGIGLPLGFLRWTWDRKPFFSMNVSLAAER
jgi:hypothetical protein